MAWVAVGLTAASVISGLLGTKKKKKAAKIEQQAVRLQNMKARTQAIKEYRLARAQVLTGITSSGADLASSAYQGIKGSLQSQLQENASFSLGQEALGNQVNKSNEQAAKYGFISSALASGANIAGGFSSLKAQNTAGTVTPSTSNPNMNPSPFQLNSNK